MPAAPEEAAYDAVVIGGAIAGAGTAITLLRKHPDARVLIVEQAERFQKKVGEATVECSALWLTAALGLGRTLAEHHLPKFGLRFFFDNGRGADLAGLDELGPEAAGPRWRASTWTGRGWTSRRSRRPRTAAPRCCGRPRSAGWSWQTPEAARPLRRR